MAKHDFTGRLSDLTKTLGFLIEDYERTYNLKAGCKYRIYRKNGKYFEGYFIRCKSSIYRGKLYVWVEFYEVKKDDSPSKRTTGEHLDDISEIVLTPF